MIRAFSLPIACLSVVLVGSAWAAEPGDRGVTPLPDRYLTDFPAMARWAAAGVAGGIPEVPVRTTVQPGADLAAAIAGGPGTVVLAAGTWRIAQHLNLPAGVVLRGAGPDTILALEATAEIRLDGVQRSGLERLRITHAAAATWMAAHPYRPLSLVGADDPAIAPTPPGTTLRYPKLTLVSCDDPAVPAGHVAVRLSKAADCWLDEVRIEAAADAPFAFRHCQRLTVRKLQVDGTARPGTGTGIARIHQVSDSLFYRWDVRDIRQIRFGGDSAGNVFLASAFAVPVYFVDSAKTTATLFEANVHLLPPDMPWRPFAYGDDPIGPGNVLVDSRSYAVGTDALAPGTAAPVGGVLIFTQYPQRNILNTETDLWERAKQFHRPLRPAPSASASATVAIAGIAPLAGCTADAGPLIRIEPGSPITTWVAAVTALPEAAASAPTGWPAPGGKINDAALSAVPATAIRNGAVDALAIAAADKKLVWLGGVLDLPADGTVVPEISGTAKTTWFVSGTALVHGQPIQLGAGKHPLWGAVTVAKPNPFAKRMETRLAFTTSVGRGVVKAEVKAPEPIPDPPGGTLYAASVTVDRSDLAGYAEVQAVHKLLASAEPAGLDDALAALAKNQAGRLGGWLAVRWSETVRLVEEAASAEKDEIKRWRLRSTGYWMSGLPQRAWAMEKFIKDRFAGAPEDTPERVLP